MRVRLYRAGNAYRDYEHKPRNVILATGSQFYGETLAEILLEQKPSLSLFSLTRASNSVREKGEQIIVLS